MNEQQRSRPPRRLSRHSTKRRASLRPPRHPGRILAIVLFSVAVIILALVWGNYLKKKSDAYRDETPMDGHLSDTETVTPIIPVTVPDIRLIEILPEGNTGDILMAGKHGGIILPLSTPDGGLYYTSTVASNAGIPFSPETPSLPADVARVNRRGFWVSCAYTTTAYATLDHAMQVYQRGLDLALLCEYAAAGADDILLYGLPSGNETADRYTLSFLSELTSLLSTLQDPPAIGVVLPLSAFASIDQTSGDLTYTGGLSPARVLTNCDYLALDLCDKAPEALEALLPRLRYAYMRYSLRILVDREAPEAVNLLLECGFDRVLEVRRREESGTTAP